MYLPRDLGLDTSDPRGVTVSHLRSARSRDGRGFTVDDHPAIWPSTDLGESGCEDEGHAALGSHIYVGRAHRRERVRLLVADAHVRLNREDGLLLGELTLDPRRDYQPRRARQEVLTDPKSLRLISSVMRMRG